MAFASRERRSKPDKEQQDAERDRLEAALEAGLEGTFLRYLSCIRRCGSNPARTRTLDRPKKLTLSKSPVLSLPTRFHS
jgi:hypothetical protein